MAEGQELAQAIVRFVGSDEQLKATQAQVLASSKALTTEVAANATQATASVTTATTASAQAVGTAGATAAAAVAQAVQPMQGLAAAAVPAATGVQDLGAKTSSATAALQEHAAWSERMKAQLDALATQTQVNTSRTEAHGGALGGLVGKLTASVVAVSSVMFVLGALAESLTKANAAATDLAFAKLTRDFTLAEVATKAADRAMSDFAANAALGKGQVEGASVAEMAYAAALNLVATATGSVTTAVRTAADANLALWDSVGKVTAGLELEKQALQNLLAGIEVDKKRATSAEELARLFAQQVTAIQRIGEIDAQTAQTKGQNAVREIQDLAKVTTDLTRKAALEQQAGEMAANLAQRVGGVREAAATKAVGVELAGIQQASDAAKQATEKAIADYEKRGQVAAAHYADLARLGQVSVEEHLAFLTQQATNERLSEEQRTKAAREFAALRVAVEQAAFAQMTALGEANKVDAIAHARAIADGYVQGSLKRIEAETQWANAVKALQADVAATGKSLAASAIADLTARGAAEAKLAADIVKASGDATDEYLADIAARRAGEVSLDQVIQQSASARAAAQATLNEFLGGGTVKAADLKRALDLSREYAAMTSQGVTAGGAIGEAFRLAERDLAGIPRTAADAAGAIGSLGTGAAGAAGQTGTATSDIVRQLDKVDAAADRVSMSFTEAGAAAGQGLAGGLSRGAGAVGAAVDGLYGVIQGRVEAGNARVAESIYTGVINRIMAALDAEAARS